MSINKLRLKLQRNKKGFTLIEIIVVLAILAILIAIAIPTMNGVLNDAKDKVVLADARAAYVAYVLKSTETATVKLSDVAAYIDKDVDDNDIAISVAPASGTLTDFYYHDEHLDDGEYVHLPLSTGESATIGALPTGASAPTALTD
jgi:prepilin-type N-terminal cleavage/methylation domain-containing protein